MMPDHSLRGRGPEVKVETEKGKWTYMGRLRRASDDAWRVDGKHPYGGVNGHWAVYDEHGQRTKQGEGTPNAPAPDELSAWDAEAGGVIARTRAFAGNFEREVFVRFGDPPEGGLSTDHRDGSLEDGLSVYRGWETPDGDYVVDQRAVDPMFLLYNRNRPAFEAEGEYVGQGGDGEPVIEDAVLRPIPPTAALYAWFGPEKLTMLRPATGSVGDPVGGEGGS